MIGTMPFTGVTRRGYRRRGLREVEGTCVRATTVRTTISRATTGRVRTSPATPGVSCALAARPGLVIVFAFAALATMMACSIAVAATGGGQDGAGGTGAVAAADPAGTTGLVAQAAVSHDVRPGYGVTRIGWLSDYHAPLRGTPMDTPVYYLESGKPGPTAVIVGGTHANEIAGIIAATMIVERAQVTAGRVIVVPHVNNSGASYPDTLHPEIGWVRIDTASGPRFFRYGDRRTNPAHQGPDPEKYVHYPSGQQFEAPEARNLDRVYPGRPDGTPTEQLAYSVLQLISRENASIAIDLHESGVTSRLANMLVANPKNLDLAVMAALDLEAQGIIMNIEPSASDFPGLSHREWGDRTGAASYLIETPNPGQEDGVEKPDVVNDPVNPLAKRVGTQLATIEAIFSAHGAAYGERPEWTGVPTYAELVKDGVGAYLR
ncbi:MAG TPA: hypothetical protein GX515_00305 [Firmicutes bacterium]|nr:hypothetical protein [Bacillota bacterium]